MINSLKILYLTSINGNVDMRCQTAYKPPICRSESTVVGNEKDSSTPKYSNVSCEVTQ